MSAVVFNERSTAEEVAAAFKDNIQGKNVLLVGATIQSLGGEFLRVIAPYAKNIWVAGRSKERLQAAGDEALSGILGNKPNIHIVQLDMTSFESILAAAAEINAQEQPIDVLVQNIMVVQSADLRRTVEGFKQQIGGNHFGTFLLVSLLLPRLRQAGPGARIVTVSSAAHAMLPFRWDDPNFKLRPEEYGPRKAYSHSKYANVLFTRELAKRLAKERISAFTLHPGRILTQGVNSLPKDVWEVYGATYLEDGTRVLPQSLAEKLKTIPQGTATYVSAAFDPSIADKSGSYPVDCQVQNDKISAEVTDENAAHLWALSEEVVGIKFL